MLEKLKTLCSQCILCNVFHNVNQTFKGLLKTSVWDSQFVSKRFSATPDLPRFHPQGRNHAV